MKDNWEELVQIASGYLELGMLEDAERALEKIASEDRKRSAVLAVQAGLYIAQKKWDLAAELASRLVKLEPKDPHGGSPSLTQREKPKASKRERPFCYRLAYFTPTTRTFCLIWLVMPALRGAWRRLSCTSVRRLILMRTFVGWLGLSRTFGRCGIGLPV